MMEGDKKDRASLIAELKKILYGKSLPEPDAMWLAMRIKELESE